MGNVKGCVLVTGATGFLGGHLIRRLAKNKFNVVATGRDAGKISALSSEGFVTFRHDLTKPIPDNADLPRIDTIIHCAALSAAVGPRRAFMEANVFATKNLVDFAKRHDVMRLIYISSPTVYFQMADNLLVKEDAPLPTPINHYAMTKRMAEEIVLEAKKLNPIILRPRGIYGPGDETLLPTLLVAAKRPFPKLRGGIASIDLTYIDDVVEAIISAFRAGPETNSNIFNISGGESIPIQEIVNKVCKAHGIEARWRNLPLKPLVVLAKVAERAVDMFPMAPTPRITPYLLGLFAFQQSLDLSKAESMLKWKPTVSFESGLGKVLKAEKSS